MATPSRALTAAPQERSPASARGNVVASPHSQASFAERIQALQGAIGNQAVGTLLGAGGQARASSSVLETLARDGRPLDPTLRSIMEHRLGSSLAAVRLHTDSRAADSARAIGAKAYAAGHHVVFGEGRFAPQSADGRRLLSHELTHVVQQRAGTFPATNFSLAAPTLHPAGSPAEREASHFSSSPTPGSIARFVPAGAVMRAPEGEGESESKGVLETVLGGLIGDFNEDPTLAEIGINTGVGLIPVVGEVTAARDVTANVYYMAKKEEYTSPGRWIGLVFAVISLFPEVGAALKGLGKAIVKGAAEALGPIIRLMEKVLEKLGHSEGIRNFFLKNWTKIVGEGTALFEKVIAKLSSLLTRAVTFLSSKAEAFAKALERIRQAAVKALPEAFEKAKSLIDGVLERFERTEGAAVAKPLEGGAEKTGAAAEKQLAAEGEEVAAATKGPESAQPASSSAAESKAVEGEAKDAGKAAGAAKALTKIETLKNDLAKEAEELSKKISAADAERYEKEVFDSTTKTIQKNRYTGRFGELAIRSILGNVSGKYRIAEQVTVKFGSKSRRFVDYVVFDRVTGEAIAAIEVKTGGAVRSAAQVAKDDLLALGKGEFGRGSEVLFGQKVKLPTIVISEDANVLGKFNVQ